MITTRLNFQLSDVTTFRLPALCDRYIEYDTPEDLPEIFSKISSDTTVKQIGGGSNLLFTKDFHGIILHSRNQVIEILDKSEGHIDIRVGAGLEMDRLIEWACDNYLWGIENLSGIPGEAGASAVQNVGAYGTEAADAILNVHTYNPDTDSWHTFGNEDCKFGYRDSVFKHRLGISKHPLIIHAVDYRLLTTPKPNIEYPALKKFFGGCVPDTPHQVRQAIMKIRDSKLPSPEKVPSAGSFFKNPVISDEQLEKIASIEGNNEFPHFAVEGGCKVPAAWLIEKCGWKGREIGPVSVWHLQPLVLTNPHRRAQGKDVVKAEHMIIDSVRERYGITLEPEVEHI